MQRPETELEMVQRHIRLGPEHIARQYQIIEEFKAKGFATEEAEQMLGKGAGPRTCGNPQSATAAFGPNSKGARPAR